MPTMYDTPCENIPAQTTQPAVTERSMKPLRVLVMEDDVIIAMLLAEVLQQMGHEVCATEATEAGAMTAATRHKPDLMIVDVWLRHGSGIVAVTEIIRSGFIPHIFVTGDSLKDQTLDPSAQVIQKPFIVSELVRAIQRALAPSGTRSADAQAER